MKRITKVFAILIAALLLVLPVAALAEDLRDSTVTIGFMYTDRVVVATDSVKLSAEEIATLNDLSKQIEEKNGIEAYVYFTEMPFVSDDYDTNLKAVEKEAFSELTENAKLQNAIALFVAFPAEGAKGERYFKIVEKGDLISLSAIEKMESKVKSDLSKDQYFAAAKRYFSELDETLNPNIFKQLWWRLLIALGIGGASAGIAVGSHKGNAKVRRRHYLRDNQITILHKNERLESSNITRHEAKNTDKKNTF